MSRRRRVSDSSDSTASTAEAARIVAELVPGSRIRIADTMTPEDEAEASFRGLISIENARAQLGWTPRYTDLREGIGEYISAYREFLGAGRAG